MRSKIIRACEKQKEKRKNYVAMLKKACDRIDRGEPESNLDYIRYMEYLMLEVV